MMHFQYDANSNTARDEAGMVRSGGAECLLLYDYPFFICSTAGLFARGNGSWIKN
jgi:hypothetical protein